MRAWYYASSASSIHELWPKVAVVAGDLPVKKDVFHFWACADVVDDQVAVTIVRALINDHADVGHASAKIPVTKSPGE